MTTEASFDGSPPLIIDASTLLPRPRQRDIYRTARLLIKIAGTALVLVFGYLQLSGADYAAIASSLSGLAPFRLALAIYYGSWILGMQFETNLGQKAYASQPNDGRFPLLGVLGALSLFLGFGLLCFWSGNPVRFSRLLAAFLFVDLLMWVYLSRRLLSDTAVKSAAIYAGQGDSRNFDQARLRLIHDVFKTGRWQIWRFGVAAFGVGVLNVLAMADVSTTVISGVILSYVLIIEGWIWFYRLRTDVQVQLLGLLSHSYVLVPKASVEGEQRLDRPL